MVAIKSYQEDDSSNGSTKECCKCRKLKDVKKKYSHTNHSQREKQREKSDHEKSFRDEKIYHPIRNNRRPNKPQRKIKLAKNGPSRQEERSHLVAQNMHCIVDISIKYGINQYYSIGSGFIFDGHIFTCSHVVDGHKIFHIAMCDGRKIRGKEPSNLSNK